MALRRFKAIVELDPLRLAHDAGQIADQIITQFTSRDDTPVRVRLIIEATLPDSLPPDLLDTIRVRCLHQRFDSVDVSDGEA
jgi:hypothetical protein